MADRPLDRRIARAVATLGGATALAGCQDVNIDANVNGSSEGGGDDGATGDDETDGSSTDDGTAGDGAEARGESADGSDGGADDSGVVGTTTIGVGAEANHDGAVVIGDASPSTIASRQPNEVRSQMPVYAPSFNTTSARAAKAGVEPVDPETVLEAAETLDVYWWQLVHGSDRRHVGPMARDFGHAFGLERSSESIATVDADGVVLAAIQGAARRLEARNDRLRQELTALDDELSALEDRLADVQEATGPPGDKNWMD